MTTATNTNRRIAIVMLGDGSSSTAQAIKVLYPQASIYGLQERVSSADFFYSDFGATLKDFYQQDVAIIALCAAGIVIRTLAPLLQQKGAEPPVLSVAEDGSAVVPLLGGLGGVNVIAREIGAALHVAPAITTSGELRFGTCLLNPPPGYVLDDIERGKRFVSDLLSGDAVHIEGEAPWLDAAQLPLDESAQHRIRVTTSARRASENELIIYARNTIALINNVVDDCADAIVAALAAADIAQPSLACVLVDVTQMGNASAHAAASALNLPLRFVDDIDAFKQQVQFAELHASDAVSLLQAPQPIEIENIGRARGRLTVIGLGPGLREFMVPAATTALAQATDILGYETYVNMAGPFRADQIMHCTDNREEMQRARHAFELAAQGRRPVVVSSGDPGVFAMAAAVLEALHESDNTAWHAVDLQIYPGVSAALATAARAGAPLGHDFCVMSLSDNLKPWAVIENRLDHAAAADFALAFYNPISKARPWQLGRALEIIARHRSGETLVVLGRDIGRPAEKLTTMTLAQLRPEHVDMRTLVIIGSSTTRSFSRGGARNAYNEGANTKLLSGAELLAGSDNEWVYTPRWYR